MADETDTDSDDPFPDHPSYEELEDMKPDMAEQLEQKQSDDDQIVSDEARRWYNMAVYVAARLIVQAAREYEGFRQDFLSDEGIGSAFLMQEYDEERYRKLNTMGLSAFQGGSAENLARSVLTDDESGGDGK